MRFSPQLDSAAEARAALEPGRYYYFQDMLLLFISPPRRAAELMLVIASYSACYHRQPVRRLDECPLLKKRAGGAISLISARPRIAPRYAAAASPYCRPIKLPPRGMSTSGVTAFRYVA